MEIMAYSSVFLNPRSIANLPNCSPSGLTTVSPINELSTSIFFSRDRQDRITGWKIAREARRISNVRLTMLRRRLGPIRLQLIICHRAHHLRIRNRGEEQIMRAAWRQSSPCVSPGPDVVVMDINMPKMNGTFCTDCISGHSAHTISADIADLRIGFAVWWVLHGYIS